MLSADKMYSSMRRCSLCDTMNCYSESCPPHIPSTGRVMIIGFNPTKTDTMMNMPFSGEDGRELSLILADAGLKKKQVYLTHLVKGFREDKKPGQREKKTCAARFLTREIVAFKPFKIVALGADVLKYFAPKAKVSELSNQILVGKHFHVFMGNQFSYFRRSGVDSREFIAFKRELTRFLSGDYTVDDVTPIGNSDQLLDCTYETSFIAETQNTRVDTDPYEYIEYSSGPSALNQFSKFNIHTTKPVAFDIETDRLKLDCMPFSDTVVSVAVSDGTTALSVALADLRKSQQQELYNLILMMMVHRPIIGHNTKFDLKPFIRALVTKTSDETYQRIKIYDTMAVSFLNNELEGSYKLKTLLFNIFGLPNYTDVDFSDIRNAPLPQLRRYNARYAYWTWTLFKKLWVELTPIQRRLCSQLISRIILCFTYMEVCGLPYNQRVTANISRFLEKSITAADSQLLDICGFDINSRSTKQMSAFISARKWRLVDVDRTTSGDIARNADNLAKLVAANPKNALVREFTQAVLTRNKYLDMRSKLNGKNALSKFVLEDGRIHTSWWYAVAKTGRPSTSEPNILNIDRADTLPKPMQAEVKVQPRFQFITSSAEREMTKADLSQAELRVLACMSSDKALTKAYVDNKDVHTETAADICVVKVSDVVKWMRQAAKCFHPDTEVLTRRGWKHIVDLAHGEEVIQAIPQRGKVMLEWVVPTEVFTKRHPMKTLVHLKNEGINLRVTPDHRMLAFKTSGIHKVVMPSDMCKQRYWMNAGVLNSGSLEVDHMLLKLAVATQADGNYSSNKAIRFGFTRERKIRRMKMLLRSCGPADWVHHGPDKRGVHWFTINGTLSQKIRDLLTYSKMLPWRWLSLSVECRRVVINEARYWDGSKSAKFRMYKYSTVNKQNADVLQALSSITDCKTRMTFKPGLYDLSVKNHPHTRGEHLSTNVVDYKGRVACLSVPSSFVLVRDGGIPVITGQTTNFGMIYCQSKYGLCDELNKLFAEQGLDRIVTVDECDDFHARWAKKYPGAFRWIEGTKEFALEHGYTESAFGRRRHFHFTEDTGRNNAMLREAVNHPIQSTSSDITMTCMDRLLTLCRKLDGFQLVKNEYDAVYVEHYVRDRDHVVAAFKQAFMINVGDFNGFIKVPFGYEISCGRSMATMKQVWPVK